MTPTEAERLAEAVRRGCLEAARDAYEDAGISGLCAEGRWELALDAIRALDVGALARARLEGGVGSGAEREGRGEGGAGREL